MKKFSYPNAFGCLLFPWNPPGFFTRGTRAGETGFCRYFIRGLVFFLFCILIPYSAVAFRFELAPSISINEEYSDNFNHSNQNEQYEYTTSISPVLSAVITGETAGANLSYHPEYVSYDNNSDGNTWRHVADFTGWANLSRRLRLGISDSFMRTDDPTPEADTAAEVLQDPAAEIDSTIRRTRNTYYTNSAGITLNYRFGENDSVSFGYSNSILENEDPSIGDNTRHIPTIGLTYWFLPDWGFETNCTYTQGDFDQGNDLDQWDGNVRIIKRFNRQLNGFVSYNQLVAEFENDIGNYRIYNGSIGFDYAVAQDLSITFDLGHYIQDDEQEGTDELSGTSGNFMMNKTYRQGSVGLVASGGYDEEYFGAENLGLSSFYEIGGTASYQFTRQASGNIFSSYRNSDYEDIVPDRDDETITAGFGFAFRVLQWMNLSFDYTYRIYDTTQNENDYVENRGMIRVTFSPAQPYRVKWE